jgi:AraC-like DNA-binding protein
MTDKGSQFMNDTLIQYANSAGITHLSSIPYSKNEIIERTNKEVNRLIRNIIFDHDVIDEWSSYLHMMEKLFNSSIKQPTGTTPNTLVFGGLIDANQGFLMTEPEITKTKNTRSIRDHVDKLMHQQRTLIAVALKVQQTQNSKNIEKRC